MQPPKRTGFDSLVEAMKYLNKKGYTDAFKAKKKNIEALYSDNTYQPEDLKITAAYRFDAQTNPADESELFVIEAKDGVKGTLVISYQMEEEQNLELIKKIHVAYRSKD